MDKKFIKNAKNCQFGEFLKTKACGQTVLPGKSFLKRQKLGSLPISFTVVATRNC